MQSVTFRLGAARVLTVLLTVIGMLLALSLLGQASRFGYGHDYVFGLVPLFNVDGEQSVPALFSTLLLFAASGLLAVAGAAQADGNTARRYWTGLAAGFAVMAVDENVSLHEKLIPVLAKALGEDRPAVFHFAWVALAVVLLPALAAKYARFWWRLPPATRLGFAASAVMYLGGAVGVEMLGGAYVELYGHTPAYALLVTLEEGLEMAGVSLLIFCLIRFLAAAPPADADTLRRLGRSGSHEVPARAASVDIIVLATDAEAHPRGSRAKATP